MDAAEWKSKARRKGRPRRTRMLEAAPRPQSPPDMKDIHGISEDFQDKAREVITTEDDQQNQQVTKDRHTGRSQDKPVSVIEVGEDEDDREKNLRHISDGRRWRPPKEATLSIITEEKEDSAESPRKESDWEFDEDGSPHSVGASGDDSSEDTIVKISLDNVQEASEPKDVDRTICRNGKKITFTCLDCGRSFLRPRSSSNRTTKSTRERRPSPAWLAAAPLAAQRSSESTSRSTLPKNSSPARSAASASPSRPI
ncbi:unnamed protein product [Staurois parvus]|uniref:C2H2-type domain-containing protein n=1 Tax=Staurois parvus TaxID=386267 RepID=A0ABN9E0Q6_9NEOB|nr:unnamed protein product [Staurois parvus]